VDVQCQLRSGGGVDAEPKSLLETSFDDQDVRLVDSRRHDQNFLNAILGRHSAVASLEDAVRSDIFSHLSDIAVRTGRRITWDPAKEAIVDDEEAAKMLRRPMREPWTLSDVAED
jgi:glucose-fructose oxidoreductase